MQFSLGQGAKEKASKDFLYGGGQGNLRSSNTRSTVTCFNYGQPEHISKNSLGSSGGFQNQIQRAHQVELDQNRIPIWSWGPSNTIRMPPVSGQGSSFSAVPSVYRQASTAQVPYRSGSFQNSQNRAFRANTVKASQKFSHTRFFWILTVNLDREAIRPRFPVPSGVQWNQNKFMLVDSGASLNVCPPNFAVEFPRRPCYDPVFQGVDNRPVVVMDIKKVTLVSQFA